MGQPLYKIKCSNIKAKVLIKFVLILVMLPVRWWPVHNSIFICKYDDRRKDTYLRSGVGVLLTRLVGGREKNLLQQNTNIKTEKYHRGSQNSQQITKL